MEIDIAIKELNEASEFMWTSQQEAWKTIKERLRASEEQNNTAVALLYRCRDYIYGVSGRSVTGDELLNDLNAVIAQ